MNLSAMPVSTIICLSRLSVHRAFWMQRLTTREPDDSMMEVGIAALKAVITDNPEDDEIK